MMDSGQKTVQSEFIFYVLVKNSPNGAFSRDIVGAGSNMPLNVYRSFRPILNT